MVVPLSLNIEIVANDVCLASAFYDGDGYTYCAADLTKTVVDYIKEHRDDESVTDLRCLAIDALRATGAGFDRLELCAVKKKLPNYYGKAKNMPSNGSEDGYISITEVHTAYSRFYGDYTVKVDLAKGSVNFDAIDQTIIEDFEEIYDVKLLDYIQANPHISADISEWYNNYSLTIPMAEFNNFVSRVFYRGRCVAFFIANGVPVLQSVMEG